MVVFYFITKKFAFTVSGCLQKPSFIQCGYKERNALNFGAFLKDFDLKWGSKLALAEDTLSC